MKNKRIQPLLEQEVDVIKYVKKSFVLQHNYWKTNFCWTPLLQQEQDNGES